MAMDSSNHQRLKEQCIFAIAQANSDYVQPPEVSATLDMPPRGDQSSVLDPSRDKLSQRGEVIQKTIGWRRVQV